MVKNNIWKKKKDLENTKKLVDEFKERISPEIRWQEKLGRIEKVKLNPKIEEVGRSKLLGKYTAKLLFR